MDAGSKTCCGVFPSKCRYVVVSTGCLLIALIPGIPYSFCSQFQIFRHNSETIKTPTWNFNVVKL